MGTNHLSVGVVYLEVCSNSLGFYSNIAAIASGVTWILYFGQMEVVSLISGQFFIVSSLELVADVRPSVFTSLNFWSSSELHEVHNSSFSSPWLGE